MTHRRIYSRPKPPEKAISTIHKAKGLECDSVIVMPCDARTFPDKLDARCLLYVALSRTKSRLLLVVSRINPSPILTIQANSSRVLAAAHWWRKCTTDGGNGTSRD